MIEIKKRSNELNQVVRISILLIFGLSFAAMTPTRAFPANFSISPTSLEMSSSVKSGAFSVINGGTEKLNCQIDVKEWSQDADGKDVYTDAKDIVFFPKIMTVEPNEQRAIRIGIKGPPSLKEKTYRLFVEEIPSQKKTEEGKAPGKITAGLTIAFRYATPIFVKPVREQESGVIDKIEMSKGLVKALIKNTGNIHIKVLKVTFRGKSVDGKELFSKDIAGWYILQGLSRPYEMNVPKEHCANAATIEIDAQAEKFTINGTLNVDKKTCTH